MTRLQEDFVFAQTANAAFFVVDGPSVLDASDLDFYLFDREARMDEVWRSERTGAVARMAV